MGQTKHVFRISYSYLPARRIRCIPPWRFHSTSGGWMPWRYKLLLRRSYWLYFYMLLDLRKIQYMRWRRCDVTQFREIHQLLWLMSLELTNKHRNSTELKSRLFVGHVGDAKPSVLCENFEKIPFFLDPCPVHCWINQPIKTIPKRRKKIGAVERKIWFAPKNFVIVVQNVLTVRVREEEKNEQFLVFY